MLQPSDSQSGQSTEGAPCWRQRSCDGVVGGPPVGRATAPGAAVTTRSSLIVRKPEEITPQARVLLLYAAAHAPIALSAGMWTAVWYHDSWHVFLAPVHWWLAASVCLT